VVAVSFDAMMIIARRTRTDLYRLW
jgi:hypothetical protein